MKVGQIVQIVVIAILITALVIGNVIVFEPQMASNITGLQALFEEVLHFHPFAANSNTINEARNGEFNDYIRISGQVQPMMTIQITPRESGIVEDILIEEGTQVKEGDVIIRMSNDDLDLEILNSEANLAEKENALRNTMIQMEQEKIQLSLNILELQTEVKRKGRTLESQKRLLDDGLIGKEEYTRSEEDYLLFCKKLEVTLARAAQDSLYRSVQIKQMEESLRNMKLNMERIRKRKERS